MSAPEPAPRVGVSGWYYFLVAALVLLSLVNVSMADGWQVQIATSAATPVLVALGVLPLLLRFLVASAGIGTVEIPNVFKASWDNIRAIDSEVGTRGKLLQDAGDAAKDAGRTQDDIDALRHAADLDVEEAVPLEDLPQVQQVYLRKLDELVKAFNRNRRQREMEKVSFEEADQIAYRMRAMAPLVAGQLDVAAWLDSPSLGRQLAAIKFLDWAQNAAFAEPLVDRLTSRDSFQQFHILLALSSLADQLAFDLRRTVRLKLEAYAPDASDAPLVQVRRRLLAALE